MDFFVFLSVRTSVIKCHLSADFVCYCMVSVAAQKNSAESVMRTLSTENRELNILHNGRTVRDFIDDKIKELGSKVSVTHKQLYQSNRTLNEFIQKLTLFFMHCKN